MVPIRTAPSPNGTAPAPNHQHSNPLERARVTDIQRARILTGMAEVCSERGAANVTVAHVVERAGVSRRTFYELFEHRDACFLGAFEEAVARAGRAVLAAYDPKTRWVDRVRAALIALLCFLQDDPAMGRLLIVESLGAGPDALERRQHALATVIAAVDEVRRESQSAAGAPRLTAEGIVGGVLGVLHSRLANPSASREERGSLIELAGPLMGMIVLPYLGPGAAKRELARPRPRLASHAPSPSANPLYQLHMRLTYRTIRVLTALATNPGSSNRRVAEASEISDQGQMSKLLSRLQQLGLIHNTNSHSAARGESNAWTLTTKGWQVQSALTQQNAN